MTESRAERRKKARAEEQQRNRDLDGVLEQPRLTPFEPPASGHVVENPPVEKP